MSQAELGGARIHQNVYFRLMLIIQTGQAKRFRKYSITFAVILALSGAFAALLTLHWYVAPPKK